MLSRLKTFLWLGLLLFSGVALSSEKIVLWHSMNGLLGEEFRALVEQYNQQPKNIRLGTKIIPRYKGDYAQVMRYSLDSIGTVNAPHIVQIYEMGNLTMQADPNYFVPLNKLSEQPSKRLDEKCFIPVVRDFYKNRCGEGMASLPFTASSVVVFYNKNALRDVGVTEENFPKTWNEFEKIAWQLKKQGAEHVLGSGWLSSHHVEQLAAWHNQPIASEGNGMDGKHAELIINNPFFRRHLKKLSEWYQQGIFSLERAPTVEKAFAKGRILFLTQNANRLVAIENLVNENFEIGVAPLLYWPDFIKKPQNTITGGSSFWVLSGHKPEEYAAIERFFEFLVSKEVQTQWHRQTCYLPVVKGVKSKLDKENFYTGSLRGKAAKVALDSFSRSTPQKYSRGILLPQFPRVRQVIAQEMRQAIRNKKTVKEALEQIDILGNQVMCGGCEHVQN